MAKRYELIKSVYDTNRNLIGYIAKDEMGHSAELSLSQALNLADIGMITNARLGSSKHRPGLAGVNTDLRTLKHITKNNKPIKELFCKVGSEAITSAQRLTKDFPGRRNCIVDLNRYMNDTSSRKVCCIYGLRRTGKTILMLQSLLDLHREDVAFMVVSSKDSMNSVVQKISQLVSAGIENIYIDEITNAVGFLDGVSILADGYTAMGVHIVISGTDSYMLDMASKSELYDRMFKINTSYISYKEFKRLVKNTDVMDYIRLGGVLVPSTFYDENSTREYISTSIVDNIIKSLERTSSSRYREIKSLNQKGLLRKAIEQAIKNTNTRLIATMLTAPYEDGIGSAMQMLGNRLGITDTFDEEEVYQKLREALGVDKEMSILEASGCLDELKEFLEELGVLKTYNRYTYGRKKAKSPMDEISLFVQPGLRYRQTLILIESLMKTPSFYSLSAQAREMMHNKIIDDIEGQILEQVVIMDSLMRYEKAGVEVWQFRYNDGSREIDMVLKTGDGLVLYEIKRSDKQVDKQYKHLVSKEVADVLNYTLGGDVKERIVLYNGKSSDIAVNDTCIHYRNISAYLNR